MGKILNIDHIAIVVSNINQMRTFYEDVLGLKIERIEEMPERGIKTAFIPIGETRIELIEPLHDKSEVSSFLAKRGPGIHHFALKTNNMEKTCKRLKESNIKLIYEDAKPGAHNTLINFIHPKSLDKTLIEIVYEP
jgi:methylmalonyl-CoA epimerase